MGDPVNDLTPREAVDMVISFAALAVAVAAAIGIIAAILRGHF